MGIIDEQVGNLRFRIKELEEERDVLILRIRALEQALVEKEQKLLRK